MTNSNNKNMEDYNKKDVKFTEGLKPVTPSTDFDGDTLNTLSPVRRKKKSGIINSFANTLKQYVKTESHLEMKPREILLHMGQPAFPNMDTDWKGFDIVIVVSPNGTKFVARNRHGKTGVYISDGELTSMISNTEHNILITPFKKAVGENK